MGDSYQSEFANNRLYLPLVKSLPIKNQLLENKDLISYYNVPAHQNFSYLNEGLLIASEDHKHIVRQKTPEGDAYTERWIVCSTTFVVEDDKMMGADGVEITITSKEEVTPELVAKREAEKKEITKSYLALKKPNSSRQWLRPTMPSSS